MTFILKNDPLNATFIVYPNIEISVFDQVTFIIQICCLHNIYCFIDLSKPNT